MRTLTSLFNKAKCAFLAFFLPRHIKRILFIMALYQSSVKDKEVTAEELAELNEALKLAKTNPEALRLSATLAKGSFSSLTCTPICERTEEDISKLLESLPSWMRYARSDDLKKDVLRLIEYSEQHA